MPLTPSGLWYPAPIRTPMYMTEADLKNGVLTRPWAMWFQNVYGAGKETEAVSLSVDDLSSWQFVQGPVCFTSSVDPTGLSIAGSGVTQTTIGGHLTGCISRFFFFPGADNVLDITINAINHTPHTTNTAEFRPFCVLIPRQQTTAISLGLAFGMATTQKIDVVYCVFGATSALSVIEALGNYTFNAGSSIQVRFKTRYTTSDSCLKLSYAECLEDGVSVGGPVINERELDWTPWGYQLFIGTFARGNPSSTFAIKYTSVTVTTGSIVGAKFGSTAF